MSKSEFKRLFKVASEFNSSTSTIVDILSSQGYEIRHKPNYKVNKKMLNALEDYFGENNYTKTSLKAENLDLGVKHEVVKEGDTQINFKSLFGDYLIRNTSKVIIVDPYIRLPYQIENLMHFIKFILKTVDDNSVISINLTTSNEADYKEFTNDTLKKISDNLNKYGVNFTFQLDDSIHDRFVRIDDKWKIIMGRGLDIYQESKLTELSNYDLKSRSCKDFNITYLPTGSF